jgi:hypothetical protein
LYESTVDKTRRVLNYSSSVTLKEGVVRRYLYLKGDCYGSVGAVIEHAEEAGRVIKNAQQRVKVVEFGGSGHVGHLAVDPEGY